MGEKKGHPLPSWNTGFFTLNKKVLGCGGLPKGRVIEFYGPPSSGKTTIALHMAAEVQKQGGVVVFQDAEYALDINHAAFLGVNIDELVVNQPNCAEEALDIVEGIVDNKAADLIIVDSVAALVPRVELEGEMGQSHMGVMARLMSQALRKLTGKCAKSGVTIIFINQIREKIGVMFGSPETTPGGNALKFYSSIRLDIRRRGAIKQGEELIGHEIEVKAQKNKCAIPFQTTILELDYNYGFNIDKDLVEYAIMSEIIEKAGGWLVFDDKSYRMNDLPLDKVRKAVLDKVEV